MWSCFQKDGSSQAARTYSYRIETLYLQYLPSVSSFSLYRKEFEIETFNDLLNWILRNFVSKWVLKAHHLTHERISAPNYPCSECNRSFTTRGTLNRHKASHSDSRPFLCPYCQKSFKTYSVCKKHVRTHANEVIHEVRNILKWFMCCFS